jgi:hypothetical protein
VSGAARTRRLAEHLAALTPPLRPIARSVLAETSRIDVVALDPEGRAVVIIDGGEDDRAGLTRALAAAAWLEARLSDWCQLAPGLAIDARAPVRALLVASRLSPETRAAARLVGAARVGLLARQRPAASRSPLPASEEAPPADAGDTSAAPPWRDGAPPAPEPSRTAPPAAGRTRGPQRPRRPFRCGLEAGDLGTRDRHP